METVSNYICSQNYLACTLLYIFFFLPPSVYINIVGSLYVKEQKNIIYHTGYTSNQLVKTRYYITGWADCVI